MSDAISLGDALKKFLETSKMRNGLQSMKVEDQWEKIIGPAIANMTEKVEIRDQTLFIHTSVAALRNELVFQKTLILQRINEAMGENIISEIVIC